MPEPNDVFNAHSSSDPGNAPEKETTEEVTENKNETVDDADIKDHPAYQKALAKNKELSTNLSEQGKIIGKKNERIAELTRANPIDESKFTYQKADIKFSKDLTASEREEMTQAEIDMMDKTAKAQMKVYEHEMKQATEARDAEVKSEVEAEVEDGGKKLDSTERKSVIDTTIGAMAKGDSERERELREVIKKLNLTGMSEEQVKATIEQDAPKLLPNYTPPKENQSAASQSNAVNSGGGNESSEALADRIIAETEKNQGGTYEL